MPGIGVEELWMDWGEGGHDIQPQWYSGICYAASSKCGTCGVAKNRNQFSRKEWNRLSYEVQEVLCINCEKEASGSAKCTCNLEREVWTLCPVCVENATRMSNMAHSRASSKATKLRIDSA